jgi:agmatinase
MKFKDLVTECNFMGSCDKYDESKAVIVGIPMDYTVSFRPGTRMGPAKIREVSYGLEDYSILADDSLENKHFFDAGNLDIPFGNVDKSLKMIGEVAQDILSDDKIPVFLGGEHLISYPIIKEVTKKYPDLVVLHFDAHADLRDSYCGEKLSHATVLRRASEHLKEKHIYQFGIRSGIKEEFIFAKGHTNIYPCKVREPFFQVLEELKNRPIYVTLDIDVLDPAFAPGTGTPEPGGCSSQEILEVILAFKKLNIVGFDLVEVSPAYDPSEITSILGAKILREVLIALEK